MASPKKRRDGVTRHVTRLRRGKFLVASAATAGLAAIGSGGALVATASSAAAVPSATLNAPTVQGLCGTQFTNSSNVAAFASVVFSQTGSNLPAGAHEYIQLSGPDAAVGEAEVTVGNDGSWDVSVVIPESTGANTGWWIGHDIFWDVVDATGTQQLASGSVMLGADCTNFTAPKAVLNVTPTSGHAPLGVAADASGSTGATSYDFAWGDGSSTGFQSAATANHKYNTAGDYTVTVTAKNNVGTDTASKTVKVTPASPPPTTCASKDKDSDGSTTAWYSDLAWSINGKAYSSAQKALDEAQPGDKIVLTGNADVPVNCTTQAFAALYLVPKNSNQILLSSQVVKPESGKSFTLTVTLPTPPNDLVSCNQKYTLQYDSGVGDVLPIIGTDKGETYLYGKRKFANGYGKTDFTAPPCQTESPSPSPTHTYTPPPVTTSPTPSPTPTSSPSPTLSSSPTPSASPTVAPSPSSSPYVPGPGNTGDAPFSSGGSSGQLMVGGLAIIAGLVLLGLAIAEAFGRRPQTGVSD